MDLGRNVTFSGGFAIQQDFDWLVGIPKSTILHQTNNMELYFEVDDFEAFWSRLQQHPDVDLVHGTQNALQWHQRVVRLYDPDWHMIEVGESMTVVVQRLLREGNDVEAAPAEMTQLPVGFVEQCREGME